MMKFNNILKEEKEGKTIPLTNMDRKLLNLLQKEKVDPKKIEDILLFLNDVLVIMDEDLIVRLTKLYHFNWKPGMFECDEVREVDCELTDFSDMKKGIISLGEESYPDTIRALSENLDIDPLFIEENWAGSFGRTETWLPEYGILHPTGIYKGQGRSYMESRMYVVAEGRDQAYDAAYSRVREDWEDNGASWFSEQFIEPFTEVSYDWVENEAERRADDDAANAGDEEDMREELGVTTDYNSYMDDMGFVKEDIVKTLTQIQEAEFKRDEIEKEKILLEKEIERRNPTPVEKLEMRSMDSFPYSIKLTDYWQDKEGYDVNGEEEEDYTLTQQDVDDYSSTEIEDSFNYDENDQDY